MKKKQVKRVIAWLLLIALVAGLTVMPLLAAEKEEETGPKASVLSAEAVIENLEVSLKGGGTLSAGTAMDVKIPSGVKITKFLVENGDTVRKGDSVAVVDKVSVMNAIVEVRDTMEYLQKQITSAKDDTISSYISAAAGGRVKQVFAQKGDSVMDVMLEHGALAVLSLDGRMAVELERKTSLGGGDSVLVKLEDGTEINGRVESNLNGKLVVTVEDKGYAVDEKVTVTTEDGDRIGSGSLYVHNAWAATGYSGTVNTVYAKEEATIYEGNTLFVLTDTEYTGNLDHYSNLHREYEELLQELFAMYETEALTAPCDGIVSGVEEDSAFLLSAIDGEQGWFVDLLSTDSKAEETGWTVVLLSNTEVPLCTGEDKEGSCKALEHKEGCAMYCTGLASCPVVKDKEHKFTCLTHCISAKESGKCTALNHKTSCIEKCEGASQEGQCPADEDCHKPGCIESCISTDGKKDCPATGTHKDDCLERCDKTESCFATVHHYPECLTLCTGDESCTALNHKEGCYMAKLTYYGWAALVRQAGTEELIVAADTQTRYQLKNGKNGLELVEPAAIKTDLLITEQTVAVENPSVYKPGDVLLFWTAYSGETPVKTGETVYTRIAITQPNTGVQGGLPGMSGMGGLAGFAGFGGLSGFGGMFGGSIGGMTGGSVTTEQELYDLNGDVLMTVTDHSVMKLSVALDERDITKVRIGQTAEVKVTALKGELFEAEITDIGMEGTGSGGSSKFTVELTFDWQEDMLAGMNATAEIPLYTKMEVLTIPVAALTEEKGRTVIYTALDPETGEPTSAREITTGISDGEKVEVLDGLKNGETVYYSYYDVLELDHTAKAENGMFG